MATSCLFAAAVITVLSTGHIHGYYRRKLYIISPVLNRHQNAEKIYWNLQPIERWSRGKNHRQTEDDNMQTVNGKKYEDYLGDQFTSTEQWNSGERQTHGRQYSEADHILNTYRDNPENELDDISQEQNPRCQHRVRNIKKDYIQWRQNKLFYELYRSINEDDLRNLNRQMQLLNGNNDVSTETIKRDNRNRQSNLFVWGNSWLDDTRGPAVTKENNDFVGNEMWRQQLGDADPLQKVRRKRSPKMTRAKILKRQRRKKRRKEIRMQRKRMRIIRHDPEDDKFVASEEKKKPTITYDYSTHEERPKKDMDEEFVSKMPRRGELGEFGEGSDEDSDERENKAKEVTDEGDKKKKSKKEGGDKVKKGGDKPKGKKGGDKPKGKKSGDRGKAKKGGSKKGGGKKGKKEKGKGKKKKAAGRDTKAKHTFTGRNLQHNYDAFDYGQRVSMDRPRAFHGNQPNVVAGQSSTTHKRHNTVFNQMQRSASGSGIDHPLRYHQYQVGSSDFLHSVLHVKHSTGNKENADIYERRKVLADFQKIFGQKNTVKLLMNKHRSHLRDENNNNKASLRRMYNIGGNKFIQ